MTCYGEGECDRRNADAVCDRIEYRSRGTDLVQGASEIAVDPVACAEDRQEYDSEDRLGMVEDEDDNRNHEPKPQQGDEIGQSRPVGARVCRGHAVHARTPRLWRAKSQRTSAAATTMSAGRV